ncbi:MAG: DUF512 domain-containing protein [Clostridiales bacterium]|nr:DUF512 domain-containing protein [Clostridiales bacterium]
MSAKIEEVKKKSPSFYAGIKKGETLISINGEEVVDVLDYQFLSYDAELEVTLSDENGNIRNVTVKKEDGDELGLSFTTYLIDKMRRCKNNCIFCFIDQLPKGMRKSLYLKDDDARMSFLLGNYISLTNLKEKEIDRVIRMRISPINISVQTTNPELRVKMLGNKNAGESLKIMKRFFDSGIRMNAQVVVCPGINDGKELEKTLVDLTAMYPIVSSISVVPVGLTKHRTGLYPLVPVNQKSAGEILDITERYGKKCLDRFQSRVVYPSDELYLKAKRPYPDTEFYEDFPQFENGVGMLALFSSEFRKNVDDADKLKCKPFTAVTGEATGEFLRSLIDYAGIKCDNLQYEIRTIENHFFGNTVDVTGLVTGSDILEEFNQSKPLYRVLVPACMLRYDRDMFLDSVTVDTLQESIKVPLEIIETDGNTFFESIFC